jgi:hypothetical protein
MLKYIPFLFLLAALLSCNVAKRLEKQQQSLNELVNSVNANKVLSVKDSLVFVKGETSFIKDTVKLIDTSSRVERYFINTYNYVKDTVKIFQRDTNREQALTGEKEKFKAQAEALENSVSEWKRIFWIMFFVCLGLALIIGLLLKFKL